MKLVGNATILAGGLLLAGMLGACQNENDNALFPQAPATVSDQNAKTSGVVGQLIKDGKVSFTYNAQGALSKETYDNGAYHVLTHSPGYINSKRYITGFPNPTMESKYTINSDGRCVLSFVDGKGIVYAYNANGQLGSYYTASNQNEKVEFSYAGTGGSLSSASFYDASGKMTRQLKFIYDLTQPIPDKHPLNPDVFVKGISKYLPVFGKFSNNLVQSCTEKKFSNGQEISSTEYLYSYELASSGKAKKVTVKKLDGTLVSMTERKYNE